MLVYGPIGMDQGMLRVGLVQLDDGFTGVCLADDNLVGSSKLFRYSFRRWRGGVAFVGQRR